MSIFFNWLRRSFRLPVVNGSLVRNLLLVASGLFVASLAQAVTVSVVPSAPGVKQSAGQGLSGYTTEGFGAPFAVGSITNGSSSIGTYTTTGNTTSIYNQTNPIFDGNFVGVNSGGTMTFTLSQPSRYIGIFVMWLSAGSTYEFLDANDNVLASLDSANLVSLLNSGAVADDGRTYTGSQYIASGQTEYSAYINLRLSDPSLTFSKIRMTATGGGGNESDNITISSNYDLPGSTPASIPTLSEWGMIFMASLMAMFGIRRMRRSK